MKFFLLFFVFVRSVEPIKEVLYATRQYLCRFPLILTSLLFFFNQFLTRVSTGCTETKELICQGTGRSTDLRLRSPDTREDLGPTSVSSNSSVVYKSYV